MLFPLATDLLTNYMINYIVHCHMKSHEYNKVTPDINRASSTFAIFKIQINLQDYFINPPHRYPAHLSLAQNLPKFQSQSDYITLL